MSRSTQDQLVHFISDMYSVEEQALAQLITAPDIAGDPSLSGDFRKHYAETALQADMIRARLEAHGGSPSAIKGAIMKLGGKGFLLFAKLMPETPGRLAAHAFSYEAMEWAGYEMLIRLADEAGDAETAEIARKIRDEERTMMDRLERGFDAAEAASHRHLKADEQPLDLRKHIAEAHALELQSTTLLEKSRKIAGDGPLTEICAHHLEKARKHAQMLEDRVNTLGGSLSGFKDTAMGMAGLNWGFFFQAQSDTPAKLAAFAYAYEHLKIAGYELLRRTATRAGEIETAALCERLLDEERDMADELVSTFDSAVHTTLAVVAH